MKIELSEQELDIIAMALGKLPMETSFPIFNKIKAQVECFKAIGEQEVNEEQPKIEGK